MGTQIPRYRCRTGRDTAVVTLTDSVTKQRKEFVLGKHDSPKSRELYFRLIAEWEAGGRRLPSVTVRDTTGGLSITALCLSYWMWAKGYYSQREIDNIKISLRNLRKFYGSEEVHDVGPNAMRKFRESMIGEPYNWSRTYTNAQISRIKRMYKWAASREMIDVRVYESLRTLESLKRGRTEARETPRVQPVDMAIVEKTLPHLNKQVSALVQLQLCTGARPGELVLLRACDIDRSGETWIYLPSNHKTAHLDKDRTIYLGPRAQRLIIPFLDRDGCEYLFSPAEAMEEYHAEMESERVTPANVGNRRGVNTRENPKKKPGDHYTPGSYRQAIQRACRRAFPCPDEFHGDERKQWHKDHRWHPYQLRHTAATLIRAQHGLEAAQLLLGHSSAMVTDAVYAERDQTKIMKIAGEVG